MQKSFFFKFFTPLSRIILNASINRICKINYPTQKIPVIKFMAKTKKSQKSSPDSNILAETPAAICVHLKF